MNKKNVNSALTFALVALAFILGAVAYPGLPSRIASHWDAAGVVNGYMGKFWGTFLVPSMMLGLFGLYLLIPRIDPLGKNIESFRKYYDGFWIALFVFLFYTYALVLAWNFQVRFNFSTALMPAFSALFFCLGIFLKKSKRNWFVGIRTPWTLSSDIVWEKTHRLSGRLFILSSFFILLGIFFPGYFLYFVLVPVVATSLFSIGYSFWLYRRL